MSPEQVHALKFAAALAGTALLAWEALARRSARGEKSRRLRAAFLALLGAVGFLGWWNFLEFRYPGFVNAGDTFHYYLGAKYFPELGYRRLYECTAVADVEAGLGREVRARLIRDLTTYELVSARSAIERPERCRSHFTPGRWTAFTRDIAFFRERRPSETWERLQSDHGYNGTPVWGLLGSALADTGPASEARISALVLLDPLLIAAMWGVVLWAFGWRAACVALLFWGTNYPADFLWTGGSFLRQDWLFASVAGVCLLRRDRPFGAGLLLGWATLLRLFPAALLAGVAFGAVVRASRERSLEPARRLAPVALGALLAFALLIPLTWATPVGGGGAWREFGETIRLHAATPFTTDIGLRTALAESSGVPNRVATSAPELEREWKATRKARFREKLVWYGLLVAAYLALLAVALAREDAWVAAALSVGAVVVAVDLSNYYFSFLLLTGLLWTRRAAIGIALCAFSAVGWLIAWSSESYDEVFARISVAAVAFVFVATFAMWPRRDGSGAER